jgi:serine/threonine protein kinase
VGTLDDGRLFYVMKLVRGERLDGHVARPASTADRLRIFERLCDTVAFAHAHGVIHRDLKPENIMIGAFGEVLVLDWGVAKVLGSSPTPGDETNDSFLVEGSATHHGTVLGTPGYMAPEQADGDIARVDTRADVYALGGILGFLLAADTDLRNVTRLPRPLVAIVRRARSPEVERRYASVQDLASEVTRHAAGLPVEAYREGIVDRTRRVVVRYRIPILLVAAYLAVRVLLLLVAGA